MISYLTWRIISLDFTKLTLLTKGWVWYDIWINELTYSQLSKDEETDLFIYHHITDNGQSLFWFVNWESKKVFEELIKISGVWWKVAQQILSMWIERLLWAVESEDNKTIESVKGVGKKMAEKIVLEFKDKDLWIEFTSSKKQKSSIAPDLHRSIKTTLISMGYQPRDVDDKLRDLPQDMKNAGEIIPYIIKELS